TQEVADGAEGAGAGTVKLRRSIEKRDALLLAGDRIFRQRPGKAAALLNRDAEARVRHLHLVPDRRLQEVSQPPSGDLLDNQPQDVSRKTVLPDGPRLMDKRQGRQLGQKLFARVVEGRRCGTRRVELVHRAVASRAVGNSGSVSK